jgi:hypothetical protein
MPVLSNDDLSLLAAMLRSQAALLEDASGDRLGAALRRRAALIASMAGGGLRGDLAPAT